MGAPRPSIPHTLHMTTIGLLSITPATLSILISTHAHFAQPTFPVSPYNSPISPSHLPALQSNSPSSPLSFGITSDDSRTNKIPTVHLVFSPSCHIHPTSFHPLVFQPFRQLFPFFLDSLPFPWQFFPSFSHYFDHLVCLLHTSLPTYMPITSFTGFPALQSILCLLPTLTSPPLANLSNSLAPTFSVYLFSLFFQPIISVNLLATFSTLWVSSLICLYQILCPLPLPLVFQPFS